MLNIENEACGVCYNPQSETEVLNAIKLLLCDPTLRGKYASMAESRVYSEYTVDHVYEKLFSIWKKS